MGVACLPSCLSLSLYHSPRLAPACLPSLPTVVSSLLLVPTRTFALAPCLIIMSFHLFILFYQAHAPLSLLSMLPLSIPLPCPDYAMSLCLLLFSPPFPFLLYILVYSVLLTFDGVLPRRLGLENFGEWRNRQDRHLSTTYHRPYHHYFGRLAFAPSSPKEAFALCLFAFNLFSPRAHTARTL